MVDIEFEKWIKGTVREYCNPDMIHATLRGFEEQLEEAEGKKKLVLEAFIEAIKRSLGKV